MDGPASKTSTTFDSPAPETAADTLTRVEEFTLEVAGEKGEGRKSSYSILVQGEVRASSILSSKDPEESVTMLENDAKLLCGSVYGDTAGFVVSGEILAAEFDDPEPTVKVDGAFVDTGRWPTVKEYIGYGPEQESVEDPFPNSGELGASPGDPLNPEEYLVELDAGELDETEAYCFDIDGEVVDQPDGMTVSEKGDRVYGCLHPGCTATITVRGVITRIETADGIGFSVSAQ